MITTPVTCFMLFAMIIHRINCTMSKSCPEDIVEKMHLSMEYGIWRGWSQAIVITPFHTQGCEESTVRAIKCLAINGIGGSVNPINLEKSTRVDRRLGVIILLHSINDETLNETFKLMIEANKHSMFSESFEWFIIPMHSADHSKIINILEVASIRFDSNIVVAYQNKGNTNNEIQVENLLCGGNFKNDKIKVSKWNERGFRINERKQYQRAKKDSKEPKKIDYGFDGINNNNDGRTSAKFPTANKNKSYFKSSKRYANLTRNKVLRKDSKDHTLFNFGLYFDNSKRFRMRKVQKKYPLDTIKSNNGGFVLYQFFKVRSNSTLYYYKLGAWTVNNSFSEVEPVYPVETRKFLKENIIIGRLNASFDKMEISDHLNDEESPTDAVLMDDVMKYLESSFQANASIRYWGKLGVAAYDGTWNGLLGAVNDALIDIALEPVNVDNTKLQISNFKFVFPVGRTMRSIYIHQQETSAVRDIFLAPFKPTLIISVIATIVIIALTKVALGLSQRLQESLENRGYIESLMWCWGIMCQQGGSWNPKGIPSRLVLILSLLFGLVVYNAYAAFITSVLSIRVASVDDVADVLRINDIKIGYIKNGADQVYLMSTKDQNLNKFYIKGYSNPNHLVDNIAEGLSKAAKENYAFFASQLEARVALRSLSQDRGRCYIKEILLPSTKSDFSFALPKKSPFSKPILLRFVYYLDLIGIGEITWTNRERLQRRIISLYNDAFGEQIFEE